MKKIIITKKIWNRNNFINFSNKFILIKSLNIKKINHIKPKIIFFIHWSKKVPSNIFNNYTCIQFHSSNLPLFRGGTPIQNQIVRGIKKTKITAFKITSKIDAGDICLKKNLSLSGSAQKIYEEMEKKAVEMANLISKKKLIFIPQKGKKSFYKRRAPDQSNLSKTNIHDLSFFYDFIRMLDAKDYPAAFINFKRFQISFRNVKKKKNYLEGSFKIEKK